MIKLVVFLGNPGLEYQNTRHNVGWMIADSLSFSGQLVWRRKFKGSTADYRGVRFLKPLTFMNRSGESVLACAAYYRIEPSELLVVHDDMERPFGTVELRRGGGLAGHNGLKDVARVLGTREFERLPFGISRPQRATPARHVLERFSAGEEPLLPSFVAAAARLLEQRLEGELP